MARSALRTRLNRTVAVVVGLGGGGSTPILATLALSGTLTVGTAASGVIIVGTAAGSTVALSGAGAAGLTVSGSGTTRTINGTPTTAGSITVTETLAGATGSPKSGALGTVGAAVSTAQRVIHSTDWAFDVDDVPALAFQIAQHLAGNINLIGVMVSSRSTYGAPGVEAMLATYGVTGVPVYTYKTPAEGGLSTDIGTVESGSASGYSLALRDQFGSTAVKAKSRTNYPGTSIGWRTLLAAAPDASVSIDCVGSPVDWFEFLASPADGISPLTGQQLSDAKIKDWYQMGGRFDAAVQEFNVAISKPAMIALKQQPWRRIWQGYEFANPIQIMPPRFTNPLIDPVAKAYEVYGIENVLTDDRRAAYDPSSGYISRYPGAKAANTSSALGDVTIDPTTGVSTFAANASGKDELLTRTAGNTAYQNLLDAALADITKPLPADFRGGFIELAETTGGLFRDPNYAGFLAILGSSLGNTDNDPTRVASGASNFIRFNGTDQWLTIRDSRRLDGPSIAAGVSFRATALPSSGEATLVSRMKGNATKVWFWRLMLNSTGNLVAYFYTSLTSGTPAATIASTATVAAGSWNRAVAWHDGTNVHLRLNGVEVATPIACGALPNGVSPVTTADVRIGSRNTSGNIDFFNGDVANAFVKSGTALTLAEVQAFEAQMVASASTKQGITLP